MIETLVLAFFWILLGVAILALEPGDILYTLLLVALSMTATYALLWWVMNFWR